MAKQAGKDKITFGKRRVGKYKKSSGPKEQREKPYNRQG